MAADSSDGSSSKLLKWPYFEAMDEIMQGQISVNNKRNADSTVDFESEVSGHAYNLVVN